MKKRIRILFIFFLLFLIRNNGFSQKTFQKILSQSLQSSILRASADKQSVFIIGNTFYLGEENILIGKINPLNGDFDWVKLHSSKYSQLVIRQCLVQQDGLLIAANDSENSTPSSFLIKYDLQGKLLWTKQIGKANYSKIFDIAEDEQEKVWISAIHLGVTSSDSSYYYTTQMSKSGALATGYKHIYKPTHFFITESHFNLAKLIPTYDRSQIIALIDANTPFSDMGTLQYVSSPHYRPCLDFFERFDSTGYFTSFLSNLKKKSTFFIAPDLMLSSGENTIWKNGTDTKYNCLTITDFKKNEIIQIHKTENYEKIFDIDNNSFFTYDEKQNTITKFDSKINQIWRKQLDKCLETSNFDALSINDGFVFTVRNVKGKTLIALFDKNGNNSDCSTKSLPVSSMVKFPEEKIYNFNSYNLTRSTKISQTPLFVPDENIMLSSKDFCVKVDATFSFPDTVCLKAGYSPIIVDTSSLIKHIWRIPNQGLDDKIPNLTFTKKGNAFVFHNVELGICRDSISKKVKVLEVPKLILKDTVVCGSPSLTINLKDNVTTARFMNKQPINEEISITKSGLYNFLIQNNSCADSTKINVKIIDFQSPFVLPKTPVCQNEDFPIVLSNFKNIIWDKNQLLQDTLFIKDDKKHSYSATYTLDTVCKITGTLEVKRKKCTDSELYQIYAPNIFSPNQDGSNDNWTILSPFSEVIELNIYDLWGNHIFMQKGKNATWDGTSLDGNLSLQGVYTWLIFFKDLRDNEIKKISGNVMLLK